MVALQQNLVATASAHQPVAEFVKARRLVAGAQQDYHCHKKEGRLRRPLRRECAQASHAEVLQSPASAATGSTRAVAATRRGAAFGISAAMVPTIMIQTPIQIQPTSGFR